MISDQQIQTVKAVPIVSYLQSIGHNPVKQSGAQLVYLSPMRDEQTPSFWVNPEKNVFNDFGGGQRGDVVRLVQLVTGCTFREAVDTLLRFDGAMLDPCPVSFSFSGQDETQSNGQTGLIVTEVKPLQHIALWQYVKGRGISTQIAKTYLNEVRCKNGEKEYFYVGFANDGGGYALRNKFFKQAISPNGITTIEGQNSTVVNLFEGFFDFLSACEFFEFVKPRHTTIILNSLVHLPNVLERLKMAQKVNVYFDNDNAGKKGLETIKATGANVFDGSSYYASHKDFNEFLAEKHSSKS